MPDKFFECLTYSPAFIGDICLAVGCQDAEGRCICSIK